MEQQTTAHAAQGELRAAISGAIVQVMHDYTGRGPTKARTTINNDLVVVQMADTFLKAERSLIASGKGDMVLEMRRCFQQTMREEFTKTVEQLTGRKVVAFMSDSHVEPDMAVEIFVLEPEPTRVAAELDGDGSAPR